MVNLTVSLPDEVVKRLRKTVKERYGGRKGALSGLVRDALDERLAELGSVSPPARFRALDHGREVAEGRSLDELVSKLKSAGVDPRGVRIVSNEPIRPVARAGLRGTRR